MRWPGREESATRATAKGEPASTTIARRGRRLCMHRYVPAKHVRGQRTMGPDQLDGSLFGRDGGSATGVIGPPSAAPRAASPEAAPVKIIPKLTLALVAETCAVLAITDPCARGESGASSKRTACETTR